MLSLKKSTTIVKTVFFLCSLFFEKSANKNLSLQLVALELSNPKAPIKVLAV